MKGLGASASAEQALVNHAPAGHGPTGFDPSRGPMRVQLSRKKGWRMPPNTVKVDRTNKTFGNIFTIGSTPSHFSTALPDTCETVEQAVACFRYNADTWMTLTRGRWIEPLRGANLACWCRIGHPCHADVLLELANPSVIETRQGGDGTAPSRSDESAAGAAGDGQTPSDSTHEGVEHNG